MYKFDCYSDTTTTQPLLPLINVSLPLKKMAGSSLILALKAIMREEEEEGSEGLLLSRLCFHSERNIHVWQKIHFSLNKFCSQLLLRCSLCGKITCSNLSKPWCLCFNLQTILFQSRKYKIQNA